MASPPFSLQWFLQEESVHYIQSEVETSPWVTVYRSTKDDISSLTIYSALIPSDGVKTSLAKPSWDLLLGNSQPACVQYYGNQERVEYFRFGHAGGIEPIVIYRDFHGIKPSYCELNEEFRLFHNLCYERAREKYVKILDDGTEEDVAELRPDQVSIRLLRLQQFLAIKDMQLAVFFHSVRRRPERLAEFGLSGNTREYAGDRYRYSLTLQDYRSPGQDVARSFTFLLGKKIIPGVSKEESDFWPFAKNQPRYVEFVIDVDGTGNDVVFSCDPDALANYFGKNEGSPHYLTPVFFRREVLTKYYSNPAKYSVQDGYLSCGGLWGMPIDNNTAEYVVVYLGDLGQHLSYQEQLYWRSFNIPPAGSISKVAWRDFLAIPSDADRPDLVFKGKYDAFRGLWEHRFGWPLFLPLASEDLHFFDTLRIPLTGDPAEFDNQILSLAKVLIDSLNEQAIGEGISAKAPGAKGISKFETFLMEHEAEGIAEHIQYLRDLQELRSCSVAHRKGSNFQKMAKAFGIGERDSREIMDQVFGRAIALLGYLQDTFLSPPPPVITK